MFSVIRRACHQRKAAGRSMPLSIRCEQSTKEGGLDVWLGRLGMVGFTAAIGVEIATGKGLLEVLHMLWAFYIQADTDYLLAIATMVLGNSVGFHPESHRLTKFLAYKHIKNFQMSESYHSYKLRNS